MTTDSERPVGLTAVATAVLLPAVWALYLAGRLLMEAVALFGGLEEAGESDFAIVKAVLGIVGGLALTALGFLLLAVGRGVWRMVHWAHRLTLGVAILCGSFFGVLGLLSLYSGDWTGAAIQLPLAGFLGWTVWYLNQPAVERLFSPAGAATAPPPPPSKTEES